MKKLFTLLLCLLLTACGSKKTSEEIIEEEFNFIGIWEVVSATYNDSTFTIKELESMNDYSCSGLYVVIKEGGSVIAIDKGVNNGVSSYEKEGDVLTLESGYTLEPQEDGKINLLMDDNYLTLRKYSNSQDITNVPKWSEPQEEVEEEIEEEVLSEIKEEEIQVEERVGIRSEFKEAMDAYESFYDEYVSFMKKYQDNPSDLAILADYAKFMVKVADMDKKFEAWDDGDLSNEELSYYIEVQGRVLQKIATIY